jgi:hypothetical protein
MTKSNSIHKFTIAAAFGAAALFSMLSFGSTAEAANVLSCQGNTAGQVISCCEKLVKKNGRPVWMIDDGVSCKKIAVCRGGFNGIAAAVVKRCYIGRPLETHEGPGPQGTKRGPN